MVKWFQSLAAIVVLVVLVGGADACCKKRPAPNPCPQPVPCCKVQCVEWRKVYDCGHWECVKKCLGTKRVWVWDSWHYVAVIVTKCVPCNDIPCNCWPAE